MYYQLNTLAMLSWALTFFVFALIAGFFGFFGVATAAAGIAKVLFVLFLVLFVASLLFRIADRADTTIERHI
jgi:uncharacterized membrane protein YtjA (UPF0391 family)